MRGYKVVRRYKEGFYSANNNLKLSSALCLRYPLGEVVIAPEGTQGIYIFLNKKDAKAFINGDPLWSILEVEILSRVVPRKFNLVAHAVKSEVFNRTEYNEHIRRRGAYIMNSPTGTYTCRKVRPIRCVLKGDETMYTKIT